MNEDDQKQIFIDGIEKHRQVKALYEQMLLVLRETVRVNPTGRDVESFAQELTERIGGKIALLNLVIDEFEELVKRNFPEDKG